jgi:hypothetical protein
VFVFAAISITIIDSGLPSDDRKLVVALRNANGGASVSADNSSVSIVLIAQHHAAGLVSFNETTYFVKEGLAIGYIILVP